MHLHQDEASGLCKVKITKTFNYGFAPQMETVFVDYYTLELFNYDGSWLIQNIEGLVDPMLQEVFKSESVDLDNRISVEYYYNNIQNVIESKKNSIKQNNYDSIVSKETLLPEMTISNLSYNRNGAVAYALQDALSPNTDYANFTDYGGDCTNFVSQVLNEGGGIPEHYGSSYRLDLLITARTTNRKNASFFQYYYGITANSNLLSP